MNSQEDVDLARRLGAQLREARGKMTQEDLVGESGTSYLSEVENGKAEVSVRLLHRYLQGCGWTLSAFFAAMEKRS